MEDWWCRRLWLSPMAMQHHGGDSRQCVGTVRLGGTTAMVVLE